MTVINTIAWILLVIGGLHWLLIGLFAFNLVTAISFGVGIISSIIYILVGLSAIWLLILPICFGGRIVLWNGRERM